jgi:tRNA dimethylallyltransferase
MVSKASLEQIGDSSKTPVGILTGPTATGKSGLGVELALNFGNIEIINADSLLVYRGMDIGTAKPTEKERQSILHHLVDIRDPNDPFTAGEFKRAADHAIEEIHSKGKRALIVGGTGFYLKSLLFGLWDAPPADPEIRKLLDQKTNDELYLDLIKSDEASALKIGKSDRYRLIRSLEIIALTGKSPTELQANQNKTPDPRFSLWILDRSNPELYERIHQRTSQMIEEGLIDEFQKVENQFPTSRALHSIGYVQVASYLRGQAPDGRKIRPGLPGLKDEIELATRQLVKQQRTWFRNLSPQVPQGQWFQLDEDRLKLEIAFKTLYDKPSLKKEEAGHE